MANFGEMEIKLTEESIAAINEFSAALNHFSDEMSKTVVAFQELKSAQHSVNQTAGSLAKNRGLAWQWCSQAPAAGYANRWAEARKE